MDGTTRGGSVRALRDSSAALDLPDIVPGHVLVSPASIGTLVALVALVMVAIVVAAHLWSGIDG